MKKFIPLSLLVASLVTLPIVGFSQTVAPASGSVGSEKAATGAPITASPKVLTYNGAMKIIENKNNVAIKNLIESEMLKLKTTCKGKYSPGTDLSTNAQTINNCYIANAATLDAGLKLAGINISADTLVKIIAHFHNF